MTSKQFRLTLRVGAALLAGAVSLQAANAQAPAFSGGQREDSGTALNRHLKDLADNPRGLSSLIGAAKAALELGDAQAAVTFYARAEEIAPRDGRIKAGIGAAFLAMEQPAPALRFLEEARGLGVSDGELAADRGLAHDLLGDPLAAQRDYLVAMRSNDTDELRRRLALSRAISGDRNGALAALRDQLARQDRAGWRVRAFVLALTGDAAGATEAARAVMPQQAAAMQPFFSRLPSLGAADRAMAVHFGRFPGDPPAQTFEYPQSYAGLSSGVTAAGRPDAGQSGFTPSRPTTNSLNNAQLATRAGTQVSRSVQQPQAQYSQPRLIEPARPAPFTFQPAAPGSSGLAQAQPPLSQPPRSSWEPASSQPSRSVPVQPAQSQPTRVAAAQPVTPPPQRPRVREALPNSAEGGGRRTFRPSTTAALNDGALAQSRPVTQPAPGGTQLAANTARPPAPAFEGVGTLGARTGPVQGPPNGNTPPSAVAVLPPVQAPAPSAIAPPVQAPAPAAAATQSVGATVSPVPPASAPAASLAPVQGIGAPLPADTPPPSSSISLQSNPSAASTAPAQASPAPSTVSAPPVARAPTASGLASIAATIQALKPEPEPARPAAVKPKPEPEKKPEPAKTQAAKVPSRHWVQVAGTADKAALGSEFARIRAKAPKLLAGKAAWTTPLRYTNRLLVGPFGSSAEAQDFVNELAKADLSAFTWTSPAGQEIVKLTAK